MYISLIGIILGTAIIIYSIVLIFTFKKRIDKQNIQLLNAYLDRKLFSKFVSIIKNSNLDVFDNAVNLITTYYDLNRIAIYCKDSANFLYHPDGNNWLLKRYIDNQLDQINLKIQERKFFSSIIHVAEKVFRVYIVPFGTDKDQFLILLSNPNCIKNELTHVIDSIEEMISLVFYCFKKTL